MSSTPHQACLLRCNRCTATNIPQLQSLHVFQMRSTEQVAFAVGLFWMGGRQCGCAPCELLLCSLTPALCLPCRPCRLHAVILSRFVPIVRTMAPFVAGIGSMQYSQFAMYNVVGALLWTGICTGEGRGPRSGRWGPSKADHAGGDAS